MPLLLMDADDVNYALKKKGWTQAALSRALAVDISTVNNVIHSRTTSSRIAWFIADKLDKTVEQVWPGRYSGESAQPSRVTMTETKEEK
jgi:lambda repressor-like predicted transcriptional regulator